MLISDRFIVILFFLPLVHRLAMLISRMFYMRNFIFRMDLKVDIPTKSKDTYAALCDFKRIGLITGTPLPFMKVAQAEIRRQKHLQDQLLSHLALRRVQPAHNRFYHRAILLTHWQIPPLLDWEEDVRSPYSSRL